MTGNYLRWGGTGPFQPVRSSLRPSNRFDLQVIGESGFDRRRDSIEGKGLHGNGTDHPMALDDRFDHVPSQLRPRLAYPLRPGCEWGTVV